MVGITSTGPVPSPSDAAGLSGTQIVQARRGREYIGVQGLSPDKGHAAPTCGAGAARPHIQTPTAGPASLRSGPGSARRSPVAAGRRHQWRSGAQPRQIVTPYLHLRCRRRTRAHAKPNAWSCLTRSGPGSARRGPAAAGRRHRILLISPPNSKYAGLRRRRGPVLPFLFILKVSPRMRAHGPSIGDPQTMRSNFLSGFVPIRFGTTRGYSSVLRSPQSR